MCSVKDEMVGHLCECSKMAQMQYKHGLDIIARIVHWLIAKQYGLDVAVKWCKHRPELVIETATIKLLWDFTIQTDCEIQVRKPDVVLVNRKENECTIIDVAVLGDASIADKEKEKDKIQK